MIGFWLAIALALLFILWVGVLMLWLLGELDPFVPEDARIMLWTLVIGTVCSLLWPVTLALLPFAVIGFLVKVGWGKR